MQKSEETRKRAHEIYAKLERVRLTLNLTHSEWSDILQLTERNYAYHYLLTNCEFLPAVAVYSASKNLEISFESLLSDSASIDYRALYEHFNGNSDYIPERYTDAAYSVRRTSSNMMAFVERQLGFDAPFSIMRKLQVKPSIFHDLNAKININFSEDVMNAIAERGATPAFFQAMGANSISQTVGLEFTKPLKKSRSIHELYERYFDETIKVIEKNTLYRIVSKGPSHIIIEANQNPEVVDALKNPNYGSTHICEFKKGGLSALPIYADCEPTNAVKIKCIHHGDKSCQWLVQFEKNKLRQRSASSRMSVVQ